MSAYLCTWSLLYFWYSCLMAQGSPECTSGFINCDLLRARATKIGSNQGVSLNSLTADQSLVIPGMWFSCGGSITSLLLGVDIRDGVSLQDNLVFDLWRPTSVFTSHIRILSSRRIILLKAGDFSSDGMIEYHLPDAISFQHNDVIGIFHLTSAGESRVHLYSANTTSTTAPLGFEVNKANYQSDRIGMTGHQPYNRHLLLRPVINGPDSCLHGFLSESELRQQILQVNINGVVSRPRQQRLFPDIQFTCNGLITKWIVGAQTRTNGNRMPELQIWRNVSGNTFTKISSSLLIPSETGNSNVHEYTPDPPLMFQDGDILGVYQPEDSQSQLVLYYQDNTGPVNYRQSGLVDNPLSSFTYSGTPANEYDYPLVSVEVYVTTALPSQAASVIPSSLVTESVITSSVVVQETLKTHVSLTQSPSVLTEVNSKVTATKLAIPASPNLMTSSLQFSVIPTSYLAVQLQQSVHSSIASRIKLLSASLHGSIRSTTTPPIPSLTPLAPLLADSIPVLVTVIIAVISGFIMMVVVVITVTLVFLFTWWRRSHKNTHSVQYPVVNTSDEIVELQQNACYMVVATNDERDETNAYEYISDNDNIDPLVVLEQDVADSRQISLQQNVCYCTTSKVNDSERDE